MKTILIGLVLLGWMAVPLTPVGADDFSGKRAIFDEGIGWTTREGADRALRRVQEAGFNVYVPNVWHGRGTTWPSPLAAWDFYLRPRPLPGDDPLKYLISKAHAMGIEVHPWFTVVLRQSDLFPEMAGPGTPEHAFDVHNGRFRQWMVALITEVVHQYDVDGINLDYIRTMGLCTGLACREEYLRLYGRDLMTDSVQYQIKPGRVPSITQWQEDAVSGLVRKISEAVRKEKPGITISADVAPDLLPPVQGQNGIFWVNAGWLDRIFRMDYFRPVDFQRTESVRSRLVRPDALTLLISNNERIAPNRGISREGVWLGETVTAIQERWPRTGIGIYLLSMLTGEQVRVLKAGPFREMSRKDDPIEGGRR